MGRGEMAGVDGASLTQRTAPRPRTAIAGRGRGRASRASAKIEASRWRVDCFPAMPLLWPSEGRKGGDRKASYSVAQTRSTPAMGPAWVSPISCWRQPSPLCFAHW